MTVDRRTNDRVRVASNKVVDLFSTPGGRKAARAIMNGKQQTVVFRNKAIRLHLRSSRLARPVRPAAG